MPMTTCPCGRLTEAGRCDQCTEPARDEKAEEARLYALRVQLEARQARMAG